ncbi:MAG: hypothetical protein H6937_02430 [Burkholderiales bacterium]|nr:hypothetical protein [Burkholderiales bacterium]
MSENEYTPFSLTKEEKESDLWKKLENHFQERINVEREVNDSIRSEDYTNFTRGKILAYKEIVGLGDE